MRTLLSLLVAGIPMDVFERDAPFSVVETSGAVTLSAREVPGSAFKEYRVQTAVPWAAAPLCAFIFDWGTRSGDGPGITRHVLLAEGERERVVYQQISQPIVSRRDFAFTSMHLPSASGPCRVRFRITNALAPPKPEGFVRLTAMWGEWVVEPLGSGSLVTYTQFSDPGGSIPAFLVHGPARDATKGAVVTMLAKASAANVPRTP
ncbi:MAG: hypothetical protein SFW67_06455 [Myxococcaceae bacterium]|nr:hypothetical protein [Myxococcaceae bacterium]